MNQLPLSTRQKGQTAEETAAAYLQTLGWRIVLRNWHCRQGEIDILAQDPTSKEYVCVEVRSSKKNKVRPEITLSWTKYQKLVRTILSLSWLHNKPVRVDFMVVIGQKVAAHYRDLRDTDLQPTHKLAYAFQE